MSLIPLDYGSSDENEDLTPADSKNSSIRKPPPAETSNQPEIKTTSSLFSSLPPPSNTSSATNDDSCSQRKKIQIFVDLAPDRLETEDDKTEKATPTRGSNLFAMLPPPKKAKTHHTADRDQKPKSAPAMVPYTLTKKKPIVAPKPLIPEPTNQMDKNDVDVDPDSFFTLTEPSYDQCDTAEPAGPSLPPPASAAQASQLSTHIHAPTQPSSSASASAQYAYSASAQYAYSASAQYAYSAPTDYYTSQYPSYHPDSGTAPGTDTSGEIPEYALKAFGTRDRSAQFKEISQSQLMDDSWRLEAMRNASKQQGSAGIKPLAASKGAKRKHNIMSLAAEARQREEALAEMAANRRANKQASRAKYGF